jgi:urea transport system ATP-binding protein
LKATARRAACCFAARQPSERARIDEILETVRLSAVRKRLAGELSHGQKQWLEIGMLLAQEAGAAAGGRAGRRHDRCRDRGHRDLLRRINQTRTVVVGGA